MRNIWLFECKNVIFYDLIPVVLVNLLVHKKVHLDYAVSDQTDSIVQMNDFNYHSKPHHLQYSMKQLKQICSRYYQEYAPTVFLVLQAELGITSQRKFYRMCRLFIGDIGLEKLAFIVEFRYLVPLLKLINQWMSKQFFHDDTTIIGSFPLPLCLPARNGEAKALKEQADISYNPSKKM